MAGRNYPKGVKAEDSARVQVGNQVSETVVVHGIAVTDQTTNSVETVAAKGKASV